MLIILLSNVSAVAIDLRPAVVTSVARGLCSPGVGGTPYSGLCGGGSAQKPGCLFYARSILKGRKIAILVYERVHKIGCKVEEMVAKGEV